MIWPLKSRLAHVVGIASAVFVVLPPALDGLAYAQSQAGSPADAMQPNAAIQPNAADRHQVFLPGYGELTVYGAAANASTDDTDAHVYLYLPPLRLRTTDDGRPDARRGVRDQTVEFFLEGSSSGLAARLHAALEGRGVSVLLKNVRPLQYSFMALDDDSETWRAYVPPDRNSLPLTQSWIRFVAEFGLEQNETDPAGEFLERLNDDSVYFRVVLGYGGRALVRNTVELTTRQLLETDFYADLSGDGESKYVTRNQVRNALASVRTDIAKRVYQEDPTVNVPILEWPDDVWEMQTVAWDNFLDNYMQSVSRYGFDGNDLKADRFNEFAERLKEEAEDESKDFIDVSAAYQAEASFLGLMSGGMSASGNMKKEDFERHRRLSDWGVEWDGEVYRPRTIDLLVMDESALERNERIASYVISGRRDEQRLGFSIATTRRAPGGDFPTGAVVAFDREDGCPPGWEKYQAGNGRFIVGTGRHVERNQYGTAVVELQLGDQGGQRSHRLSVEEMPRHSHRVVVDPNSCLGSEVAEVGIGNLSGEGSRHRFMYDNAVPWSNMFAGILITEEGGSEAHDNVPPFVALHLCRSY